MIQTARKIGSPPRDLVKRAKSKAFLFGKLRREFADASEETIRETIDGLRWEEWPEVPITATPRAPIRGREPVADRVWDERVRALARLAETPVDAAALVARAVGDLGWDPNFAVQVLAAGEERGVFAYGGGVWHAEILTTAGAPTVQIPLFVVPAAPRRPRVPRPKRERREPPAGQLGLFDWRKPEAPSGVVARLPSRPPPSLPLAAVG